MQQKIMLSAGVGGAVLMGMEITASRLLVPHFGDSLAVWGSLIGIVLVALSLGYYVGGLLADRFPKNEGLAILLLTCTIFVASMPLLAYSLPSIASHFEHFGVLIGALLFVIPSILLGMISPYCVRLQAHNIKHIGSLSGNISAASTIGSVVGTFGTTFFLILVLPVPQIFLLLAGLCLATAALVWRGWHYALVIVLVLISLLILFGNAHHPQTIDEGNVSISAPSHYGDVRVWDDEGIRRIAISGGKMSAMNISNPTAVPHAWEFIGCMDAAMMVNPDIHDALIIGIGGGLHARRLAEIYDVNVDAVDINSVVVDLANKYFRLSEYSKISTFTGDGRRFLAQSDKTYDLISLDVVQYNNFSYRMPFHLATEEFFSLAKEHLSEKGVVMHHVLSDRNNTFLHSIISTLNSEFEAVYLVDCNGSQIVVASNDKVTPVANNKYQEQLVERFYNSESTGVVLTDDYAPINPFAEAFVTN